MQNHLTDIISGEREDKLLILLIFLGLLVRIIFLVTAPSIDIDGIDYMKAAQDFVNGEFGRAFNNIRLPAYPLAAAFFHLFIPDLELTGRITSLFFGILLIVFCLHFVQKRWGWKPAVWITVLISLHPYLARYSSRVLSESLATFLFTGSILCFYSGWTEKRTRNLVCSGVFLALAYLTRAEYIIYFIPLCLVLVLDRQRWKAVPAFLICPAVLTISFLIYLRLHTGLWVIDKKILYWGGVDAGMDMVAYLTNLVTIHTVIPNLFEVSIHFGEAIFLPLLVLAIFGLRRTERPYIYLVLLLVLVHLLGRSFVSHSTKRYSFEFVPLVLIFAVNGIMVIKDFLGHYSKGKSIQVSFLIILFISLLMAGIFPLAHGRGMEKKAGNLLKAYGSGKVIASRLPIMAFYANGTWVSLEELAKKSGTPEDLGFRLQSKKINYVATDIRIENELPVVAAYATGLIPLISLDSKKEYIRIYSVVP